MKKIISVIFISLLLVSLAAPAALASNLPSWYPEDVKNFKDFYGQNLPHIVDDADIFTSSEEAELTNMIKSVTDKYGYDLVIYTDTTNYGLGPYEEQCAIDFYRFNGYGLGKEQSGVIIYVNMDPGNRYISYVGTGDVENRAYEYNETIRENMLSDMSAGNYFSAMKTGIELTEELYETGKISHKRTPGDYLFCGAAAAIVGLIAGAINSSSKVRKMKNVNFATYANDYIVQNSFNLRGVNEMFLYKNVTRTVIQTSSDGGSRGGGSSHSGIHSSGGGGHSFSGGSSHF